MIKAVFFDQDNTIFNTSVHSKNLYLEAISLMEKNLGLTKGLLYEVWKSVVEQAKLSKHPHERTFDYSLKQALLELQQPSNYYQEVLNTFYSKLVETIELTPGTKEFFEKDLDVVKILFTEDSAMNNNRKLEKFGLQSEFDLILNSDITLVMKPHMKYLEIAWEKFNLNPEDCLYIGDNWEKDLKLGQEHGGIGVIFGSKDERADFSISNMLDLLNIIKNS